MPLRSAQQYIESLRDGRTVYFRGQRVPDVTTHPVISVAVRPCGHRLPPGRGRAAPRAVRCRRRAARILALLPDSAHPRRSAEAQRAHRAGDRGRGDARRADQGDRDRRALFGLLRVAPRGRRQARHRRTRSASARYYEHCRDEDLALAVAQTDVKGDRSLGPRSRPTPTSTSTSSTADRTASSCAARRRTPR